MSLTVSIVCDFHYFCKHCQGKHLLLDLWVAGVICVETYVTYLSDPLTSPASSLFNDFGALSISQRRKVGEIETYLKQNGMNVEVILVITYIVQYSLKWGEGFSWTVVFFFLFVYPFLCYISPVCRILFYLCALNRNILCKDLKYFLFLYVLR